MAYRTLTQKRLAMRTIPTILNTKTEAVIVLILTTPERIAMALGGVVIGSMKT